MSLENRSDAAPETKLAPQSTLDAAKNLILRNTRNALFIAGLAVGSTASAEEMPKPTQEQLEARDAKVQLQKQQLDRELAQNAGILGALREDSTLKSSLGATGLTEAEIAANRSSNVQLQKQQLDREISENAGILGALREDSTIKSALGATGLSQNMMNGLGTKISEKPTSLGLGETLNAAQTPSKEALLKQQQQLQMEKEALERKMAENAKLLKAMSE